MTAANSKGSHTTHIKSAYINVKEFDEAQMHRRFNGISDAMRSRTEKEIGFEPSDVTPRSLSLLTGNLRAFVESALGKSADPEARKITKFPHKLFLDYRPEGALYIILCACLNFKYLHGLRRFEFSNKDKRPFNFELLYRIEKSLKEARMLPMVKVFFARSVPASVQPSLRAIIQKRGVTVSSASAATHILYPDPPGTTVSETNGTDYCRPLEWKDNTVLVHWWYHPDSYDSWIPRADVDDVPDPVEDHEGQWHVQVRWLEDTEMYNEWMNEADYEITGNRMNVIPAPRADTASTLANENSVKAYASYSDKPGKSENRDPLETSDMPERIAPLRKIEQSGKLEHEEKSLKKRKRIGSSATSKHQSVSSRHGTDAVSERDSQRKASQNNSKPDEMDLGVSSDDSELETIRKRRRSRDGSGRDRRGRNPSEHDKVHKDGSAETLRKKARVSEEVRKVAGKSETLHSVKLRLSLKAPHVIAKDRLKEKYREHRGREIRKSDKRDVSSDSRGTSALKVRVKLGKLPDGKRIAEQAESRRDPKMRESDNDDAMSAKSKVVHLQGNKQDEDRRKSDGDRRDKKSGRDTKVALVKKDTVPSSVHTAGGENEAHHEGTGQEQKRPFSRRKSKKKERTQQIQMPGVSVVDDAIPIAEGELPRIRNISREGADDVIMKEHGSPLANGNFSDSMVGVAEDEKVRKEGMNRASSVGEDNMEVDRHIENGRVMAISEKMLQGDDANAPVSTADLVSSLETITVRIPAHSRWFRMDAIHDIEKRSLSEFFNNRAESKTPMIYKKYRDFMVDVWRQAPDKHLTATSARRHLAGDVCAILRVHAFLEHWGLINYGTEPESKPYLSSSLRGRSSCPRPVFLDGQVREQTNGVPRLLFFDEPRPPRRESAPVSLQNAVKAAKDKTMRERTPSLLSSRELYATAAATKYECDACGTDCSRMRYHCVGAADMELCPSCFANGMYPETLSARDFEQLTTVLGSEAHDGSVWSEAEVLLLLEGLEKYGDDWNQVSEHVGSKTNEQCVLQFLRMPIEDSFLGDQLGKWDMKQEEQDDVDVVQEGAFDGEHKFSGPLLPFADTANPVMAQVAFLAASVSPEVAAAAAQAALHEIMCESSGKSCVTQEGPTAQAKALLQGPDEEPGGIKGENGLGGRNGGSRSRLGGLPGSKVDVMAVEAAASVGLAAAVAKAKKLADAEVREIEREFAIVVETKLRAVDLKLQEFARLEGHVRRERERLEKQRQNVYADRVEVALMRTGNGMQASRVAAAHQAAASVAAGLPVPHVYTGGAPSVPRPNDVKVIGRASGSVGGMGVAMQTDSGNK